MTPFGEIVLVVGTAGGSLTLFRVPNDQGGWFWEVETNEVTLYDLLSKEDDFDPRDAVRRTSADSLEDAFQRLDTYPWIRLYPLRVHEAHREAILRAVLEGGGELQERRWRAILSESLP
jgi:hypothetical protein